MLGEWGGLGSSDGGLGSQGGGLHVWAFGWGVAYSTVAVTQLRAGLIPVPALPPIACLSATAWWVARGPAPPPQAHTGVQAPGVCADAEHLSADVGFTSVLQPAGGELRHEGPLYPRQGQIPDPRFQMHLMQQAGVCGPGG